jgi:uroporphyrinogen-III synthase
LSENATKKPVLLVRASGNEADSRALAEYGLPSVSEPYLSIGPIANPAPARRLLHNLTGATWVIATSVNAVSAWGELLNDNELSIAFKAAETSGARFAAMGLASANALKTMGVRNVYIPAAPYAKDLALEVIARARSLGQRNPGVVVPVGSVSLDTLTELLESAGWNVHQETLYQTNPVVLEPTTVYGVRDGEFGAVVLRSPSAAKAFASFVGEADLPVICAGSTTARVATSLDLNVMAVAPDPSPLTVARTVFEVIGEPLDVY